MYSCFTSVLKNKGKFEKERHSDVSYRVWRMLELILAADGHLTLLCNSCLQYTMFSVH